MTVALEKNYSPAEYLDREIQAATRYEYRDGEMIEITGGTPTHNELVPEGARKGAILVKRLVELGFVPQPNLPATRIMSQFTPSSTSSRRVKAQQHPSRQPTF